jgi:hypothetical protein
MKRSLLLFFIVVAILLASAVASCCIGKQIPGMSDPIGGTWNGYVAERSDGIPVIAMSTQEADAIEAMRLNIYPDNTFDYAVNYSLRSGTIASTGKGNYIVQSAMNATARSYIYYDAEKDTLTWETQGTNIEFRRNDRVLTRQDLIEYNEELLAEMTTPPTIMPTTVVTPVPTFEIASLQSEGFGYDTTTGIVYHFNGVLRTYEGVYQDVMVILRYPDKDEYHLDLGGMGGANFTKRDMQIVLNDRVRNMTPRFFIQLDKTEYPANVTLNITRDAGGNITANYTDSNHFSAFAPVV